MKHQTKSMILLFFLCVSVSLLLFPQYAGKGRMSGNVTSEDDKPLENVKIKLYCVNAVAGFETKTDKTGKFEAAWIRGGNWNLDFEKIGYEPRKISVLVAELGKETNVSIKLKKMEGLLLTKELLDELEKGNNLFGQKKLDEAEAVYQKLLKENPDAYIIYLSIGNCYFEKKEYDKAIEIYTKVLKDEPGSVKTMIAIGNCYNQKKQTDKAFEWYNKIDINKLDNIDVLYNIGIFYFNKNQSEKAVPYLKKSIELKPDFTDGMYQLGLVYLGLNKMDEAVELFEKYLSIDSTSEQGKTAKQIVGQLKKGKK